MTPDEIHMATVKINDLLFEAWVRETAALPMCCNVRTGMLRDVVGRVFTRADIAGSSAGDSVALRRHGILHQHESWKYQLYSGIESAD